MLKAAEQYLGNADLQRAKMLSDWENWQDEPDIYAIETEQTLRKLAAKLLDEANKIETEDQPESTSNAHSLTAVFAGAGPSFDPTQLLDKELGKFDGNINVAGARAGKGDADYKKIQSIISQSGFAALSPDEQRTKLREALGAADDFELAKKVGKAIATQSSGSVEQLEALRIVASNFDVGVDKDYAKFVAATNAVAVAQGRLDAAQARLAAITDADSPLIRLAAEVEVTNARLETATALMQQLRHVDLEAPDWAGLSDEEAEAALDRIGRVYEALARNVDESSTLRQLLDSVGARKATGASLPSHAPQKSADGLPDVADDFDASLLGSIGKADGKAIAVSVPIGNRGIFSRKQAVQYVAQGGKLSDVPDVHLKESIWENVGPGKRFQVIQDGSIISGWNDKGAETRDKTTGFIDTVTGKQYVLKSPHRNDQEYVQELAGARVQQLLGIPAPGMRIAGPVELKADKDGNMSPQAPILMEHVGNLFGFDALQDVSGDLNPESFAHLVVMDRVFNYYDRTPANFVPVTMPDGTVHYHPIDHGNAFYGFLGGPTAEEAVGLIRTSKSDNIVPGQIAQSEFVTPEQKRAYGVAMMEAIRKYKRTNWRAAMKEIGDRQNLPEEARKKLEQHGEYLEARKDSLDWDTMTQTALLDLGLTAAEIQDITGEVDAKYMKYAPPADAPTPVDAGVIAQSQPAMNFGSFFAYDGGDIEDFAVQVQRTQIKGLTGPDGQPHNGDGTTLTFKLHGAAKAYEPSEADGWTVLTKGHPVPLQSAQTGATPEREAEWDFERLLVSADGTPTYAVGSNDELQPSAAGANSIMFVQTWAKTMPDGTVVMVTRPIASTGTTETKKNSLVGTVRIVAPGKPEEVLSDSAKIQEYMTAAGVTSHTAPGSMEFEQSAVRKLGRLLFGSKSDDMTYDEIAEGIAERGYSLDDDLVVRKLSNGKVQLGFSAEKTAALVEELDIQWFVHNLSDSSDEQIVETLVTGALGSTTTRFNNGIQRVGMSSATDVRRKGSGDYAFLYPITPSHIDNTSYHASQTRAYAVYLPPETIISRTDWYGTEQDVYGEIEGRTDSLDPEKYKHVDGQTSPEVMVKGQIPLTHAVVAVPKYQRDSIIAKVKARGVTEIGGVPIEEIVVASEDAQAARIAAGERARAALS
jgi:hypothetical protein